MVARSTWDPAWYGYPSLLLDGTALITRLQGTVAPDVDRQAVVTDDSAAYDTVEPPSMVLIGRTLVLLTSLGTVAVTMLLARRLAGTATAVVSGLIVAVMPALAARSAIVIVDTPATFFVMASMLAASGAADRARKGLVLSLAAGACAGLALSAKYTSGAVIVVVLVVLGFDRALDARRRVLLALVATASMVVVAVGTMPALVLRTSQVHDAIDAQTSIYDGKATPTGYLQQLVTTREVGLPVALLGVAGLVLLLVRPRSRVLTAGWIVFALVLLYPLLRTDYQPFRNLLPLLPYLAILAAASLVTAVRAAARRLGWSSRTRWAVIGLAVAILVTYVGLAGTRPAVQPLIGITDSRTAAVDWLVAHSHDGQRVLVAEELRLLPSELDRIPGQVTVASIDETSPPLELDGFDTVVTGAFTPAATGWPAVKRGAPVASFGRWPASASEHIWHGNNELVRIYATSPSPPS
jgi:hypothetical protein